MILKGTCQLIKSAIEGEKYAVTQYRKIARDVLNVDKDSVEASQFFVDLSNEHEQHLNKLSDELKKLECE
jgi:rubrerythrin